MARKKIVAGNWKMNMTSAAGQELLTALMDKNIDIADNKEVVIAPPFVYIAQVRAIINGKKGFVVAGQDCHQNTSGAFTGDVSATMLKDLGCKYVIIGHSERRGAHNETDALLASKVNTALAEGLDVIFCCGEPLEIREAGKQNDFINTQIENGLFHLDPTLFSRIVIAYEPIWAIGTGKTASAEQAQDMHANIRAALVGKYGQEIADNTSILYGGSCNAKNATELFSQPDIDGGLIGGASLKPDDFAAIIEAR